MVILTILFITLAGIFKAVADTLTHHYYTSIFSNKNERFWNPNVSWRYVKFIKFTKYRPDAWHLANSGMIVSFCVAVVIALRSKPVLWWGFELIIAGAVFIATFNLFYNKILIKR